MLWFINRWPSILMCGILSSMSLLLPGCYMLGDYQVNLPNDYVLVRSNSFDIGIFGPRELGRSSVVPPRIALIGVEQHVVFGLVEDSQDPRLLDKDERAEAWKAEQERARGYFLIDTKAHNVHVGLTKEAWMAVLRDNGIEREPRMRKPSRWLKY